MEQKISSPVQKGLIISLVLIVFGLILYFTNQYMNKGLSYIQYVILLGGIIWSCQTYAKQMNGNVTFGNVFAHGFKTTAFVAALIAVYTLVAVKFLFPEIKLIVHRVRYHYHLFRCTTCIPDNFPSGLF